MVSRHVRRLAEQRVEIRQRSILDGGWSRFQNRALLSQYTYLEKDTKRSVDKQGRVVKTEVEVYEMYPSLEPGLGYERLITRNGQPVDPRELEKKDRQHQKKVLEWQRLLETDPAEKKKRTAKAAEERRKEDEAIDDALALYSFSIKGRETIDGHGAIVLDFRPKPDAAVKTDSGRILKKVAGRAWINETDHQLIRVDAEVIDTISFGFGVLAKLNKGAHALFQRRFVNNEIWLPAEASFTGSARVLLFKGLRIDTSSEYSGYKKFSVDTSTSFAPPLSPP